jgi:hypothetical protein
VGNEHDISGLLQRSVYTNKNKMEIKRTSGNRTSRKQEDNNKKQNNAN